MNEALVIARSAFVTGDVPGAKFSPDIVLSSPGTGNAAGPQQHGNNTEGSSSG